MTADDLPLAADFPPASREDWLKLVRATLKERPYERLISKTYDGLAVEPLYARAADARPVAGRLGPWQVMVRVDHPDPAQANVEALHELENGASGLALVFAGAASAGGYGLAASEAALTRALDGVQLDAGIAVALEPGPADEEAARALAVLVRRRGHDPAALTVRFGLDPIGALAASGAAAEQWPGTAKRLAALCGELQRQGFGGPLVATDARVVHDAGGSEAQELAFALAGAVAYLRALESHGIALDAARGAIEFRLAADTDQFLTVAKLRALRRLWARVEQACGLDPRAAHVAAHTAWRMLTRRDPAVNMLRNTIAVAAAAFGGADSVAVLPHTAALGLADRFARRIARNTQLVLLEESGLAKVADPAAGAGAIEHLTQQLCLSAWTQFQEIERAGGAVAALEAGTIQQQVARVRAERERAVAHRKDALTGTSDFPDINEAPASVLDVPPVAMPQRPTAVTVEPLPRVRLAVPFERLRDACDRVLAATGARPKIFLANLGKPADLIARATFAKNFFEAGGIEAPSNDGFESLEALVAAFKASGAQLACLCSSDAVYAREAAACAGALAGARRVYLAGRGGEREQELRAAGIAEFIYAGCDVLATLRQAHDILGIDRNAGQQR